MSALFEQPKALMIAGGQVPRNISHCIDQYQYKEICKEVQAANLEAQNKTCCIIYGCCLFSCVWCLFEPVANHVFESNVSKRLAMLNQTMFDSKPVLSMRSSGRDLRFVFDTSDLKPFPVLALPVPENPPAPMNPMMNNPMMHSHILAQTGNPNVAPMMNQMMYGNQQYQQTQMPPAMDAHNNQLMYGNQMMYSQQAMMMNQQAMYGNPGMFPGQPVPGMYPGQPMPGMYGGAGMPGMYNPALISPIGAPMVEMTTPVATQVYPAVPVPSATVVAPSAPQDGSAK